MFNDPALDRLIRLVDVDNQSLRQTVANYRQARALVASAQAALYPTVIGAPSITRSRVAGTERTSISLQGQASWELDLFGETRRNIESEAALAQSDAATIALTRLTIQAEVAANYFSVRYADSLQKVLDENVENFRKTLKITENQYAAGVAARSDVVTAQTQVDTIQAQAISVRLTRVQFVNAIATLIGRRPPRWRSRWPVCPAARRRSRWASPPICWSGGPTSPRPSAWCRRRASGSAWRWRPSSPP